jgi:hypothetical protein
MSGTRYSYSIVSLVWLSALWNSWWHWPDMWLAESRLWGDYQSIIGATTWDFEKLITRPSAWNPAWSSMASGHAQMGHMNCMFNHRSGCMASGSICNCFHKTKNDCSDREFHDLGNIGLQIAIIETDQWMATGWGYLQFSWQRLEWFSRCTNVVGVISRNRYRCHVGILTTEINSTEEAGGACCYTSTGHPIHDEIMAVFWPLGTIRRVSHRVIRWFVTDQTIWRFRSAGNLIG